MNYEYTATTDGTWVTWTTSTTTSTSTDNSATWGTWITSTYSPSSTTFTPAPISEEEVARRQEVQAAADAARKAADDKATALLLENLDGQQRKDYNEKNYFIVKTARGMYRIERGNVYNVAILDNGGNAVEHICAVPSERVPLGDSLLAQLLSLKYDEEAFLRVANRRF